MTAAAGSGLTDRPHLNATVPLAADTHAPGTARALVAAYAHFLGTEQQDVAALLVSELVTNAVLHGGSEIILNLLTPPETLRVEVHDSGAPMRAGTPQPANTRQIGGRGLVIVAALATSWGVDPAPGRPGKSVWFELRASRSTDRMRRWS